MSGIPRTLYGPGSPTALAKLFSDYVLHGIACVAPQLSADAV